MRLADQLIPNNKQKMKANRSTVYVSMLLVYDVEWKELRWIKEVQLRLALFPFWVYATRLPSQLPSIAHKHPSGASQTMERRAHR